MPARLVTLVLFVALASGCAQPAAPGPAAAASTTTGPGSALDAPASPSWLNQTFSGNLGVAPCVEVPGAPCTAPISYDGRRAFLTAIDRAILNGSAALTWSAQDPLMENMTLAAGFVVPCPDDPDLRHACFSAAGNASVATGRSPLSVSLQGLQGSEEGEEVRLAVWVQAPTVEAQGLRGKLYLMQDYSIDMAALVEPETPAGS